MNGKITLKIFLALSLMTLSGVNNIQALEKDTLANCLVFANNGGVGLQNNGGANGLTMDFQNRPGSLECDTTGNAANYLFDGSPIISYNNGQVVTAMYSANTTDSFQFRPLTAPSSDEVSDPDWFLANSGQFTTQDSTLCFTVDYFSPKTSIFNNPNWKVVFNRVCYYNNSPTPIDSVFCAYGFDWNVPSDSGNRNTSFIDSPNLLMSFRGGEWGQDTGNTACQPNDQRWAASMYVPASVTGLAEHSNAGSGAMGVGFQALYTRDNASYVGANWNHPKLDTALHAINGFSKFASPAPDSQELDLHMVLNGGAYRIDPDDSLYLWFVTITGIGNNADFDNCVASVQELAPPVTPAWDVSCCEAAGDFNNDMNFNIGDATALIAYLFSSGPEAVCTEAASVCGDCTPGVADVLFMIDRFFNSGPAPVCATCDEGSTPPPPPSNDGDTLKILSGGLNCQQSSPIYVTVSTATSLAGLNLALELSYTNSSLIIDSVVSGANIASLTLRGTGTGQNDGVSPDSVFLAAAGISPIPQLIGDTVLTIWVTTADAGSIQIDTIEGSGHDNRYTLGACNELSFNFTPPAPISVSCSGALTASPDPAFLICPGGDQAFRVRITDEFDQPVVGNSSVWVEIINCPTLYVCANDPNFDTLFAVAPSDSNGVITFFAAGGGCGESCVANIKQGSSTLATVPVETFDVSGAGGQPDTLVTPADFTFDITCNDYLPDGKMSIEDFNLIQPHLGHHCDLDPCERFRADFTVTPGNNIAAGQTVTINLLLSNNAFEPCFIGPVGFLRSPFGVGTDDVLIETVFFNDTLFPGESATISVDYLVEDIGDICFSTNFLTALPCCDSIINLRHCAVSTQHCAVDSNLCYQFNIALSEFPVDNIQLIDSFLPDAGWNVFVLHEPTFPVNQLDSFVYEICTPNLASLGDSAVVWAYIFTNGSAVPKIMTTDIFLTSQTGDANGDCRVNIADVTFLIARIFSGGPGPIPPEAGDPSGDCSVNIGDVVYLIDLIFRGGPSPQPVPCTP